MNARLMFAAMLGQTFGGKRNLYKILGYEKTLTFDHFKQRYDRDGIGRRVITLPAEYTWRMPPEVIFENEADNNYFSELVPRLKLWNNLERVDRISGIGEYGVLIVGYNDGEMKLATPLKKGKKEVIFLQPYHQGSAEIDKINEDFQSADVGTVEIYKIDMNILSTLKRKNVRVHYSRTMHVAENLDENEVYGTPRLRPIINYLFDLEKVIGGGAEAFWKNAVQRVVFDVDKDASISEAAKEDMKEQIQELEHDMRQYIRTQGLTPRPIETAVTDPVGAFNVILRCISGATGYPARLLTGSERGELASSMDEQSFYTQISTRNKKHVEPYIIAPLIEKVRQGGFLQSPYKILWPPLKEVGEKERAEVAEKLCNALSKLPLIVPELMNMAEARSRIFGWPAEPDEGTAERVMENLPKKDREAIKALAEKHGLKAGQILSTISAIIR